MQNAILHQKRQDKHNSILRKILKQSALASSGIHALIGPWIPDQIF